jgi:hypothetical protein
MACMTPLTVIERPHKNLPRLPLHPIVGQHGATAYLITRKARFQIQKHCLHQLVFDLGRFAVRVRGQRMQLGHNDSVRELLLS